MNPLNYHPTELIEQLEEKYMSHGEYNNAGGHDTIEANYRLQEQYELHCLMEWKRRETIHSLQAQMIQNYRAQNQALQAEVEALRANQTPDDGDVNEDEVVINVPAYDDGDVNEDEVVINIPAYISCNIELYHNICIHPHEDVSDALKCVGSNFKALRGMNATWKQKYPASRKRTRTGTKPHRGFISLKKNGKVVSTVLFNIVEDGIVEGGKVYVEIFRACTDKEHRKKGYMGILFSILRSMEMKDSEFHFFACIDNKSIEFYKNERICFEKSTRSTKPLTALNFSGYEDHRLNLYAAIGECCEAQLRKIYEYYIKNRLVV
eukprot:g8028.t1